MKAKDLIFIALILILSFPAIKTLLAPGFFETHDGKFHLIRLAHFYECLKEGHFPVRWAEKMNDRYGYPLFNFFYPLVYYLGSLFHFLGFSLGDALKIIIFLSFILSGIFTYLWIKNLFGRASGFISAIFYIYAPYRFVSSFVSGRMGEVTAYIFIPLCFYSLTRFAQKQRFTDLILPSFSYAFLILSYNISALIFSPLILSYLIFMLYLEKNLTKASLVKFFFFLLLSYTLPAFFWVPAILEKKYVRLPLQAVYDYKRNFPSLKSYLYHPWGYGLDPTGVAGGISHQIGLAQILVILLTFGFLLKQVLVCRKRKLRWRTSLALFFFFWFVLVFFIMNKFSQPLWEIIPLLKNAQFPFRFLSIVILIASFFAGYLIYQLKNKKILLVTCCLLLVTLVLYANRNHLRPGYPERFKDEYYLNKSYLFYHPTDVAAENTPIWNYERLLSYKEKIEQEDGRGKITQIEIKPRDYRFQTESNQKMKIKVNTFYYPGWQVLIDDQKAFIAYGYKEGLIKFTVPPGKHQIRVKFTDTLLRKFANLLSLTALGLSSVLFFYHQAHRQ